MEMDLQEVQTFAIGIAEQAGEIVTVGDAITIIKENKAGKPRKVDKRKVSKSFAEQAEARAKRQAELDKALDED